MSTTAVQNVPPTVHTRLMHARNTNTYNRVRMCYHNLEHNHSTPNFSLPIRPSMIFVSSLVELTCLGRAF